MSKEKEIILVPINWYRVALALLIPIAFLLVGYLLISSRSLMEVFSRENILASTPWRPVPVVAIIASITFFGFLTYRLYTLLTANGKYLSLTKDSLKYCARPVALTHNLDHKKVYMTWLYLNPTLMIGKKDGNPVNIPMSLGIYSSEGLPDLVASAIKEFQGLR